MKCFFSLLSLFVVNLAHAEHPIAYEIKQVLEVRDSHGLIQRIYPEDHVYFEWATTGPLSSTIKLYEEEGRSWPEPFEARTNELSDLVNKQKQRVEQQFKFPFRRFGSSSISLDVGPDGGVLDQRTAIDGCKFFQKFLSLGVPEVPLRQAITAYNNSLLEFKTGKQAEFLNRHFLSLADYSKNSAIPRFYLLNMDSGEVTVEKVSQGSGRRNGGPVLGDDGDGNLLRCSFSNGKPVTTPDDEKKARENLTRVGFFRVWDYYWSPAHATKWPLLAPSRNGMVLHGLSPTNWEAEEQGVVMHEANYNSPGDVKMGLSWGCPAFVPSRGKPLIEKMRGGSLYYAYAPVCAEEMKLVIPQIPNWEKTCGDSSSN